MYEKIKEQLDSVNTIKLKEKISISFLEEPNKLKKSVIISNVSDENIVITSMSYKLVHPLTNEIEKREVIFSEGILDSPSKHTSIDLEVPFHGNFEISIEINYSTNDEQGIYDLKATVPFHDEHYNIAWLQATMPVLLFASDLLYERYDNGSTYVEIERAKTYNFSYLPSNVLKFPKSVSASGGNYNQNQILDFYDNVTYGNDNWMIKWLEELSYINHKSTFTIIGVDNVLNIVPSAILSNIDYSKLNFVIYTDGSFTDSNINQYFKHQDDFNSQFASFEYFLDGNINKERINGLMNTTYTLPASKYDNFEYVVNSIEGWNIDEELKNNIINEYNVRVLTVSNAFERLVSLDKLSDLEYLLSTRWGDGQDDSMHQYFNGNPSKNLLILGTSPAGESNENYATFEKYVEHIVSNYGNEYKLFYKGHPRYPSDSDRQKLFEDSGIVELPNSIPVETLMLLYPEVYVGGYSGTSFQSSLVGQTKFFFGPQILVEGNSTIKNMIEEGIIFSDTIFLTKDSEGNVVVVAQ